jgi:hypothetical protein
VVRTDHAGAFTCSGITPGIVSLAARAKGYATWRSTVELAPGATLGLVIPLQKGATLSGTVTSVDNTPIRDATVAVGSYGTLDYRGARTDNAGQYEVLGIAPGHREVHASASAWEQQSADLDLDNDDHVEWNPCLSKGRVLHGVIECADVPDNVRWEVFGAQQSTRGHWQRKASVTQAYFELIGCPEGRLTLTVFDSSASRTFPMAVFQGVEARAQDVHLVITYQCQQGEIMGNVVCSDGSSVSGKAVVIRRQEGMQADMARCDQSGRFHATGLPRGTYLLYLRDHQEWDGMLATVQMDGKSRIDLGTTVLPAPGLLAFHEQFAGEHGGGAVKEPVNVSIATIDDAFTLYSGRVPSDAIGITPGEYRVCVCGEHTACQTSRIHVETGRTTDVIITRCVGTRCVFRFASQSQVSECIPLRVVVLDDNSTVVRSVVVTPSDDTGYECETTLRAGTYHVKFDLRGASRRENIDVPSLSAGALSFQWELP